MNMKKGLEPPPQGETRHAEAEAAGITDAPSRSKMTFAENVILTIKILAGFGLLGVALWGIGLWTSAR